MKDQKLPNLQKMTLDEINNLSQDDQRALALKLMAAQNQKLQRISNNVLFFFWVTIFLIVATIIFIYNL